MRFQVIKGSEYGPSAEKPCEGAVRGKYYYTEERRGVGFPDEYYWYSFGVNHRETENGVARELEMEAWFITISDMYELDVFLQRIGVPVTIKLEPESAGFTHTLIIGEIS